MRKKPGSNKLRWNVTPKFYFIYQQQFFIWSMLSQLETWYCLLLILYEFLVFFLGRRKVDFSTNEILLSRTFVKIKSIFFLSLSWEKEQKNHIKSFKTKIMLLIVMIYFKWETLTIQNFGVAFTLNLYSWLIHFL